MNTTLYRRCLRARFLLAVLAGWGMALARLSAADEPAAAAPAAAPAGTWYVFSPPKDDEVISSSLRIKMLTLAKTFLERDKPELLARLQTADNPFYAKLPPPPTPVVSGDSSTSATSSGSQSATPQKISDEDRLKAVAENLQPSGMMEGNGKRLVIFDGKGGGSIEVGQSFTVTVPPDTTPVSVSIVDANESSCTLKLNTTTLPVAYFTKSAAASHPSSSTSTPQPKP